MEGESLTAAPRESGVKEKKMFKLNPEWKRYNDVMNEGGEGYNPHPKYIPAPAAPAAASAEKKASVPAAASERWLKNERGNLVRESEMRARLEKDLARLAKISDPFGRSIVEESIAHARAELNS